MLLQKLGGKREINSVLMFTPKAHSITGENLKHRANCTPLLFATIEDSNVRGRMKAEKGNVNKDTTWSFFKRNLCIGCHLLTFSTKPIHAYSRLDAIQ